MRVEPRAAVVSLLLLLPGPAWGQTVEEHSRRGVEHYEAERYAEAIEEMLRAYQLQPEAGLLYNVARIYQTMGENELALTYFKRFVASEGADPKRVKKALDRMAELRARPVAQPEPAAPAPQPVAQPEPAAPAPPPVAEPEPAAPAPQPVAQPEPVPPVREPADGDFPLGFVVGGTGLAALALGGVFGALALAAEPEIMDRDGPYTERVDTQETARAHALAADVLLGTGVVAVAAGAVLLLTADEGDEGTALAPLGGNGAWGLAVRGRIR